MAASAIAPVLTVLGTGVSMFGQFKEAKASKKQEALRQRQMELEATRQRREQVRRATVARAQATANAYNQGSGDSSGLSGGLAQITSQANRNILGINQDEQIGNQVFKTNQQIASARFIQSVGSGVSSLGKAAAEAGPDFQKQYGYSGG